MRIPGLCFALAVFTLPALPAENWTLVWSDEFNGAAHTPPNPSKWTYDLGAGGWGNQELETYTKDPQNISEDGEGHLVIRAIRNSSGGYTSARIKTAGRFAVKYGKVAARMKIPSGQGLWPAFWMLGDDIEAVEWPQCGEIDVMENIGKEPGIVHGTIHGPGYSGSKGIGHPYSLPDGRPFAGDFHVYAVEWAPDSITFLVDDHPYFTVTPASLPQGTRWVYDHSFFLLLNLAVGGGWPGNPDTTTQFPQSLVVDWVHVWQRSDRR
ncbi:MAG: glycoside hydrolase family 16 protein [Acidobacteriaceae bacterium]|nr:glycoside hydrolase family 16 protein [Acidobacteriaceae bacterium]MBV9502273.1 glycoside hydrolase family 16 protein [Acidobacteriaceae bacterium]